jgi:hypothetical protein
MFNIYYNKRRNLTPFFNIVPLLFDALGPLSHNLLYAPKIKSFALRTSHERAASFSCWSGSLLTLNACATIF